METEPNGTVPTFFPSDRRLRVNETNKSLQEQLSATTELPAQSGANRAEGPRKVWKWLLSLALVLVVVLSIANACGRWPVRQSRSEVGRR